jgi:orotate phosphoribosyltransferase
LVNGSFQETIDDTTVNKKDVKTLVFCTGKFYYDIKLIVSEPEGAALIGELMLAEILKIEPKTRSVGGLESAAIAIATAIVYASFQLQPTSRVSGFFVRKSAKAYGLEKMVEGIVHAKALCIQCPLRDRAT